MSFNTIGDAIKATKSREVSPAFSEVAIFKQLIKERADALDLVRKLLSNAGAEQVGATKIDISYTQDQNGHIFEVTDDGCGMYYTGNEALPGRLGRFMPLPPLPQPVNVNWERSAIRTNRLHHRDVIILWLRTCNRILNSCTRRP